MDADIFVPQLAETAPSLSSLEDSGLSRDEAHSFRRHYSCVKRALPLSEICGPDQMLKLLREWDLTNVQIGMIRFPTPPLSLSDSFRIGCVEADPLVILGTCGEIVVQEYGTKGHVLWRVAKNGSLLLDALLLAARFLQKRGSGAIDFEDFNKARSAANECAAAAGGEEYSDFYEILLDAE